MFGNAVNNQLHGLGECVGGHIDMGGGRLGAETIGFKPNGAPIESTIAQRVNEVQDVKIVGASETSLRNNFLIGVASSLVAGLIIWYTFERKNTAPYKRGGGYVSRSVAR